MYGILCFIFHRMNAIFIFYLQCYTKIVKNYLLVINRCNEFLRILNTLSLSNCLERDFRKQWEQNLNLL